MSQKERVRSKWITGCPELDAARRELPCIAKHPLWLTLKSRLNEMCLESDDTSRSIRQVLEGLGVNIDATLLFLSSFGSVADTAVLESIRRAEESNIAGMRCPKCGWLDSFNISCTTTHKIAPGGSEYWSGNSFTNESDCACGRSCGFEARVLDFQLTNQIPRTFKVVEILEKEAHYEMVASSPAEAVDMACGIEGDEHFLSEDEAFVDRYRVFTQFTTGTEEPSIVFRAAYSVGGKTEIERNEMTIIEAWEPGEVGVLKVFL